MITTLKNPHPMVEVQTAGTGWRQTEAPRARLCSTYRRARMAVAGGWIIAPVPGCVRLVDLGGTLVVPTVAESASGEAYCRGCAAEVLGLQVLLVHEPDEEPEPARIRPWQWAATAVAAFSVFPAVHLIVEFLTWTAR